MKADLGIAGAGRVAQALGRLLRERGETVAAVASRNRGHAREAATFIGGAEPVAFAELPSRAGRILIAVPDDALGAVAALLAPAMCGGEAVHTSGARGPEALAALAARGVACAAMHPLQTICTPEQGVADLPGAAFLVSGDGAARAWAEEMAALLGGRCLSLSDSAKPLYHAAAVMASNYVTGLIDAAAALLGAAGVPESEALAALGPLVRASAANAVAFGPAAALTGPVERGDAATVALHWHALAAAGPRGARALPRRRPARARFGAPQGAGFRESRTNRSRLERESEEGCLNYANRSASPT